MRYRDHRITKREREFKTFPSPPFFLGSLVFAQPKKPNPRTKEEEKKGNYGVMNERSIPPTPTAITAAQDQRNRSIRPRRLLSRKKERGSCSPPCRFFSFSHRERKKERCKFFSFFLFASLLLCPDAPKKKRPPSRYIYIPNYSPAPTPPPDQPPPKMQMARYTAGGKES